MILIKNGFVIENNQLVQKDVLIDGEIIKRVCSNIETEAQVIDATNLLVMPGAVDVHVHLREPGYEYKETIKTGTQSAAKGGVTSIMSMPNLNPCPDCLDHLVVQKKIIEKDAL